jgi:GNAT superfamily N-acetyltransferase
MTIAIRPMTPDDRRFVVSGWSSSWRASRDIALVPHSMWAAVMHPIIEHHIDRPIVRTFVAHGEVLHGFICAEPDYVLYLYVARPFRCCGIASALLRAAGIDVSARFGYAVRTRALWELLVVHRKAPLAIYDPYHVRFDNQQWSHE